MVVFKFLEKQFLLYYVNIFHKHKCNSKILNEMFIIRTKKTCFWNCGWREKFSPRWLKKKIFNQFSRDSLFSSFVSFAFFVFLFLFCLFVCFFEIRNICILIHIWHTHTHADGWVIKIFSPGQFLETRLLFLA